MKANWRSSAAYRIAVAFAAAFALGTMLLGTIIYFAMHIAFTRQLETMISDEARTLVTIYKSDDRQELAEVIAEREHTPARERLLYAVFTPAGQRVMGSLQTRRPALGFHDVKFVDSTGGADVALGLAVDLSPERRLLVATDREWIERIDHTILAVFGIGFLGVCGLGLGGALILGTYLRRRLRALSEGAKLIIAGNRQTRMPIGNHHDEFDQLAIALNAMLDRTDGLLNNLRDVTTGVAHELRTPLARLRNRLEKGLPDVGRSSAEADRVIGDAIAGVDEILGLFAAILRIAEIESGETSRLFKPVDLSLLATELAENYAPAVRDDGRNLLWSIEPDLTVLGDRELIAQAAANLLENTQVHTPPATLIRLTLVSAGNAVCLRISDNGPGVAKVDRGVIVERFKRLEQSRGKAGHGLGLNLVNAVAKLHQGSLSFDDCSPGLAATICFPRQFSVAQATNEQA